jgi:hypothetical protein
MSDTSDKSFFEHGAAPKGLVASLIPSGGCTFIGKTPMKDLQMKSSPPLSPPSSQRLTLPPSSIEAGMKPLAFVMADAVVDLEGGLRLEVKTSLESFAGIWIGFDEALDVGRFTRHRCGARRRCFPAPKLPDEATR